MKVSIAISALILAIGAGLGWKIDGRLATARTDESRLVTEAAGFGIPIGDGRSSRSTKRERVDRDEEARRLAVEFNTMAKIWESGRSLDTAAQERYKEIRQRFEALDSSHMRGLIVDVLASTDLPERIRAERAVGLVGMLAKNDPQGVLALITEYFEAIKIVPQVQSVVSDCLRNWAKDDPAATVDWMKRNPGSLPEEVIKSSQRAVIHSVAEKDPRLAFKLAEEFDKDPMDAMHTIVTAAGDNEARNVTLAALRDYLITHIDDPTVSQHAERAFGYFSWGFKPDGFEGAREWVASANLSLRELESFCAGLSISSNVDEPARWIEWMAATFPPGKGGDQIVSMISRWARDDYEAAGKWLGSVAEGSAKTAAIRGYVQTVFPHEPEVAMQWLMTLPPTTERQNTLEFILENHLRDDPEAAAAFAKEHGFK